VTAGNTSVLGHDETVASTRAMAMEPRVRIVGGGRDPAVADAARAALAVFHDIDRSCTRFDATSALMRANAAPHRFHVVPPECGAAIRLAHAAYQATGGLFDPRVLDDLVRLGYDRSLPFSSGAVETGRLPRRRPALGAWRPRFRGGEVSIGRHPIDLGGIGKGLAVRLAGEMLTRRGIGSFLIEAGGDCLCAGDAPAGGPWRIGVEDPSTPKSFVAVLELSGYACATSSTRVRQWTAGGKPAHHLIDPRTGLPGGGRTVAVTVVDRDPAWAEVWSKALFLAGGEMAAIADRRSIAALWVRRDGRLGTSRAMQRFVCWRADSSARLAGEPA
jgi:thiamine biosynthesis lipoprotein